MHAKVLIDIRIIYCVSIYIYIHTYIHAYIHTCLWTCIYVFRAVYLLGYSVDALGELRLWVKGLAGFGMEGLGSRSHR